jgi:hypothetical protein
MPPVTTRVDPDSLGDLFVAPPRATLAWAHEGRLELAPVRYGAARGRHLVAPAAAGAVPPTGARASLVLDDGWSWFALRAVILRGTLAACPEPPFGGASRDRWRELLPEKVTAWDYGALHVEPRP